MLEREREKNRLFSRTPDYLQCISPGSFYKPKNVTNYETFVDKSLEV